MNTNKKLNIAGRFSEALTVIITVTSLILYVIGWSFEYSKYFGLWENLGYLLLIILTLLYGYFNFNLYGKYKEFIQNRISLKELKIFWYINLIVPLIIIIFSLLVTIAGQQIIFLTIIIIFIPQLLLLIYTNPIKYKLSMNFLKKENTLTVRISHKKVVIISMIFGSLLCLVFGYFFGETQYYLPNGKRVYIETEFHKRAFNYIVGLISFIVSSGLCYLILDKKIDYV